MDKTRAAGAPGFAGKMRAGAGKSGGGAQEDTNMTTISPSILSADFCHLARQCRLVLDAGAGMLHYDVMDGHFVPNISFGVPVLKSLHAGLPEAFYDVHLMISHPLQYVEPFAKAGATLLNFHVEAEDDVAATLRAIRAAGCKTGLTIKPATLVEAIFPYLDELDLVLVMSVEPGFGGQSFQPAALDKLRALAAERQKRGAHFLLEVDGGVDAATAPLCVQAGADVLVAGSAVFGAADPAAAVRALAAL
jgi:ribulose-phosphate 3-epimerase